MHHFAADLVWSRLQVVGSSSGCYACHAEDGHQLQRQWFKQLQVVFAWLLPQHAAHAPKNMNLPAVAASDSTLAAEQQQPQRQQQPDSSGAAPVNAPAQASTTQVHVAEQAEGFDAAELYAAVKPTGSEPELTVKIEKLIPTLRPYQKRAAAWMVAREKGSLVGIHFLISDDALDICARALCWRCSVKPYRKMHSWKNVLCCRCQISLTCYC